ncbi:MAG TPA: amidohydrolase family protein [Thermoanaerobaculia bacterium]|nr:amidohydrolase family protein [Thermoanaerobaculia bacterium]
MLAATLVLTNGKIWTGDAFAHSVTIEGNRIVAIDAPVPGGAKTLDLKGRLAVPGFIDNHVHFSWGAAAVTQVRLRDAGTPEEFARRIAAQARKLGKGKWVTGGEWDEQLWQPYRLPHRSMIDAVTPDNPVFVARLDGHMALANSAALKLAGITRESKDPAGGTIVRDADGEPTGQLVSS